VSAPSFCDGAIPRHHRGVKKTKGGSRGRKNHLPRDVSLNYATSQLDTPKTGAHGRVAFFKTYPFISCASIFGYNPQNAIIHRHSSFSHLVNNSELKWLSPVLSIIDVCIHKWEALMKKILVFFSLFIVLTTSFLFGAETLLVKVIGVGETVQLAIDNGVKQAIEIAVGALVRAYAEVDSQLKVTATDIFEQTTFQERILSFSKAYIQNYVVLQTTQQWGLYYVELECAVRQTALEGAMLRNGIGFLSFEGSKLIALFEANRTTDRNAAAMIRAKKQTLSVG